MARYSVSNANLRPYFVGFEQNLYFLDVLHKNKRLNQNQSTYFDINSLGDTCLSFLTERLNVAFELNPQS